MDRCLDFLSDSELGMTQGRKSASVDRPFFPSYTLTETPQAMYKKERKTNRTH